MPRLVLTQKRDQRIVIRHKGAELIIEPAMGDAHKTRIAFTGDREFEIRRETVAPAEPLELPKPMMELPQECDCKS